jgi:hypothetical protein
VEPIATQVVKNRLGENASRGIPGAEKKNSEGLGHGLDPGLRNRERT